MIILVSDMWNVMLDELPKTWNGYPVNMDFRIGMQISMIFPDDTISEREKIEKCYDLLFDGIAPDIYEFQELIEWYMNGWYTDGVSKKKETAKVFDYDVDQWRIYSAFMTQYHIDLNTAEMHFWVFMGLLINLEECAFTRVKDIRVKKIKPKMSKEEKTALTEAKEMYALDQKEHISAEEQQKRDEAVEAFMRMTGK